MKIKRDIYPQVKKHLDKKEITLIVGPRQAGKTTILRALEKRLTKRSIFFNLDIEEDFQFFATQNDLIRKLKLEIGDNSAVVFIDEIQRKENAGAFLKGLYDMDLPYKFVVTGSGSVELKEKVQESLAGRKRMFELTTVTFREFFNYRTGYKYEKSYAQYSRLHPKRMKAYLDEYLMYGGYPRVVLAQTKSEKEEIIREIFQTYLVKDLSYILGIKKPEVVTRLIEYLSIQGGRILNYNAISSTLDIPFHDLKKYLYYLEETFIIDMVRPFYTNKQKEIVKSPVVYFTDLGMRNYAAREFNNQPTSDEAGFLFQNLVYLHLKQMYSTRTESIHFWRTKNGNEVDFVVKHAKNLLTVEVKYKMLEKSRVEKGFRAFIDKYEPEVSFVINLSLNEKSVDSGGNIVMFKPFDLFLLSKDESLLST